MDKRTILYILLVSAAFFATNLYFDSTRPPLRVPDATPKEQLPYPQVDVDSVPFISLEPGVYALPAQESLVTFGWTQTPPRSVQVDGQQYHLESSNPDHHGPVLYTTPQFYQLNLPVLDRNTFVLVVSSNSTGLHGVAAKYEQADRPLVFASEAPKQSALVVANENGSWIAIGWYDAASKQWSPLQDLSLFSTAVRVIKDHQESYQAKHYVLENETLQLVFSDVGAALSEINLPIHHENSMSVVNEIALDREIQQDSPQNAQFPLVPYWLPGKQESQRASQPGGYYPLLRRSLLHHGERHPIAPQFLSCNVVSEYPELAELVYQVVEFTHEKIVFQAIQPNRKITKTYRLIQDAPYLFELTVYIEGDRRGLWLGSGIPEVEMMSNTSSPEIQYYTTRKGKGGLEKISLPKANAALSSTTTSLDWMMNSNGYLGLLIQPINEIETGYRATAIPGTVVPSRLSLLYPDQKEYAPEKHPGYEVYLPLAARNGPQTFVIYAGPFEEGTLKIAGRAVEKEVGTNPHYTAARSFHGWFSFISKPFARVLFVVMQFFHYLTHSWGISIILLTVFLRLLLYPLNSWSIRSMRRMQKLSPRVQAIQKKYEKDAKRAQIEIMTLYREEKVNPFMGCIPLLIQLPFLIAMFDLLKSSFQLRGDSFIPGWINDLTAPDELFCWGTSIFFFGSCFHLLPFLLGGVMFLQQRLAGGKSVPTAQMTDQQRQQRAMGTMMTVVFTVMFYHFPSGLNIYWLSSSALAILQQWMTTRILDKKEHQPEILEVKDHRSSKK